MCDNPYLNFDRAPKFGWFAETWSRVRTSLFSVALYTILMNLFEGILQWDPSWVSYTFMDLRSNIATNLIWRWVQSFEAGFIFWYAELAPSMYLCHFYNVRRTTVCIVTSIAFITGYLPIYLFRRPYHPVYIKGWLTQPVHTVLRTIGAIIANVSPLYNLFGPRASTLLNKGESGPSRSLTGWLFLYGTRFWMLFPLALAIYYFFCHGTRRLAMQNDVDDREFKSRIGVYRFDFKEAVFLNNAFKTLLLGLTLFTVVNTVMQSANVFSMKELPTFLLMSLVWLAPILWFYDIYGSIVANIVRYANLRRGHIFYNPYYM